MNELNALGHEEIQTTANIICLGDRYEHYDKSKFGVQVVCRHAKTGEILLDEVILDHEKTTYENAEEIMAIFLFELEKVRKQSTAL